MSIHPLQAALIAAILWDKASTKILAKYYDYDNIFSTKLEMKLLKNTSMNEYIIKLIDKK